MLLAPSSGEADSCVPIRAMRYQMKKSKSPAINFRRNLGTRKLERQSKSRLRFN